MNTFRKIRLSAVLAGLMCVVMLAPTVVLSLHLHFVSDCTHSDCPKNPSDRPLSRHHDNHCTTCQSAHAVIGKFLSPAPVTLCAITDPVEFVQTDICDAIGNLYPHTKISRAPPLA